MRPPPSTPPKLSRVMTKPQEAISLVLTYSSILNEARLA